MAGRDYPSEKYLTPQKRVLLKSPKRKHNSTSIDVQRKQLTLDEKNNSRCTPVYITRNSKSQKEVESKLRRMVDLYTTSYEYDGKKKIKLPTKAWK